MKRSTHVAIYNEMPVGYPPSLLQHHTLGPNQPSTKSLYQNPLPNPSTRTLYQIPLPKPFTNTLFPPNKAITPPPPSSAAPPFSSAAFFPSPLLSVTSPPPFLDPLFYPLLLLADTLLQPLCSRSFSSLHFLGLPLPRPSAPSPRPSALSALQPQSPSCYDHLDAVTPSRAGKKGSQEERNETDSLSGTHRHPNRQAKTTSQSLEPGTHRGSNHQAKTP